MVIIKDGSTVTNEGLMNIFTKGGLVIQDSKFINTGVTNIVATDQPVNIDIVNTKKPKKGQVIGSISFTNKGIVIDSGNSEDD